MIFNRNSICLLTCVLIVTTVGCVTREVRNTWEGLAKTAEKQGWKTSQSYGSNREDIHRPSDSHLNSKTSPSRAVDSLNLNQPHYYDMFSLQILVYDSDYGLKFREAAEQAARTLRNDGDESYYYHGPHRSMVLVGLFTYEKAFDSHPGGQDTYSQTVRQLQKKFPYNALNGRTIIEKVKGKSNTIQSSFLVRIF